MSQTIIIIGGGHAGGMAAISLRQNKFQGVIKVITQENYLPYQKPPLSKQFLLGQMEENNLFLKSDEYYMKNNIEIIKNRKVTRIDCSKKQISLNNQSIQNYDKLIIATGSVLRQIDFGIKNTNLQYLQGLDDSKKIKSKIQISDSVVIIGGGFIGLEIASSASSYNLKTKIIEKDIRIMSRSVSREVSMFLKEKHESMGVEFFLNNSVKELHQKDDRELLVLTEKGKKILTDNIIIGIGTLANDNLAIESGIDCSNGINVNEFCQTSDENIFAIGDCANQHNSILNRRIRLESVHNAVDQAKRVASYLTGKPELPPQTPWFWSNQYNLKINIAGLYDEYDEIVMRGSIQDESFSMLYFKESKLISIFTVNRLKDFINGKKIIEQERKLPIKELRKSSHELKEFLN